METKMLSNQEIFDKVFDHAQTQKKEYGDDAQSNDAESCLYRSRIDNEHTKMCFIGVLIPDSEYDKEMEGDSVQDLFNNHPEMMVKAGLDRSQHSFLQELQYIHDYNLPNKWNQRFAEFAMNNDLECSVESTS